MYTYHFTVVLILLYSQILTSYGHPCSQAFYEIAMSKNMTVCKNLHILGAEFAWNLHSKSQTVDILIGTKLNPHVKWLAWGINPGKRPQMVGTRALIGIAQPNGSFTINTYNITRSTKLGCELLPSKIEVEVVHMNVVYFSRNNYFALNATLVLPLVYNVSRLNHVWQVGDVAVGMEPKMHRLSLPHVVGTRQIDLTSDVGHSNQFGLTYLHNLRMIHGILNIVGWGTLLPAGVIIARYFNRFPVQSKRWYFLHISCQIAGYVLGTIGWIIGLWLGNNSKSYSFPKHRILAIFIFTFTTIQVLALRLRPKKSDEFRSFWNMYHHFLGYALLAVIIANIFQGINILKPEDSCWQWAYIGLLGLLASTTIAFELFTWIKFRCYSSSSKQGGTTILQPAGGGTTTTVQLQPISDDQASTKTDVQLRTSVLTIEGSD